MAPKTFDPKPPHLDIPMSDLRNLIAVLPYRHNHVAFDGEKRLSSVIASLPKSVLVSLLEQTRLQENWLADDKLPDCMKTRHVCCDSHLRIRCDVMISMVSVAKHLVEKAEELNTVQVIDDELFEPLKQMRCIWQQPSKCLLFPRSAEWWLQRDGCPGCILTRIGENGDVLLSLLTLASVLVILQEASEKDVDWISTWVSEIQDEGMDEKVWCAKRQAMEISEAEKQRRKKDPKYTKEKELRHLEGYYTRIQPENEEEAVWIRQHMETFLQPLLPSPSPSNFGDLPPDVQWILSRSDSQRRKSSRESDHEEPVSPLFQPTDSTNIETDSRVSIFIHATDESPLDDEADSAENDITISEYSEEDKAKIEKYKGLIEKEMKGLLPTSSFSWSSSESGSSKSPQPIVSGSTSKSRSSKVSGLARRLSVTDVDPYMQLDLEPRTTIPGLILPQKLSDRHLARSPSMDSIVTASSRTEELVRRYCDTSTKSRAQSIRSVSTTSSKWPKRPISWDSQSIRSIWSTSKSPEKKRLARKPSWSDAQSMKSTSSTSSGFKQALSWWGKSKAEFDFVKSHSAEGRMQSNHFLELPVDPAVRYVRHGST